MTGRHGIGGTDLESKPAPLSVLSHRYCGTVPFHPTISLKPSRPVPSGPVLSPSVSSHATLSHRCHGTTQSDPAICLEPPCPVALRPVPSHLAPSYPTVILEQSRPVPSRPRRRTILAQHRSRKTPLISPTTQTH